MTLIVWTYLTYLAISIALTVWVARTLHRNGRVFLVDCFHGNTELADSVNHLLVVGFYLINVGFVALALKYGVVAANAKEALESLSTKIGLVLLVLGAMHFFNLAVFTGLRRPRVDEPSDRGFRSAAHPAPHQTHRRLNAVARNAGRAVTSRGLPAFAPRADANCTEC
jgi:hypothetical protein